MTQPLPADMDDTRLAALLYKGTALERSQSATLQLKLFKLAVRVVQQYADRIKLYLPTACPVAGLLSHITEIFYRTPRLKPG